MPKWESLSTDQRARLKYRLAELDAGEGAGGVDVDGVRGCAAGRGVGESVVHAAEGGVGVDLNGDIVGKVYSDTSETGFDVDVDIVGDDGGAEVKTDGAEGGLDVGSLERNAFDTAVHLSERGLDPKDVTAVSGDGLASAFSLRTVPTVRATVLREDQDDTEGYEYHGQGQFPENGPVDKALRLKEEDGTKGHAAEGSEVRAVDEAGDAWKD